MIISKSLEFRINLVGFLFVFFLCLFHSSQDLIYFYLIALPWENSIPKVISWPQISAPTADIIPAFQLAGKRKKIKKKGAKEASPVSFKKVSRSLHIIYWFTTQWLDLSHRVIICFKRRLGNILFILGHRMHSQKLKVSFWEDEQRGEKYISREN